MIANPVVQGGGADNIRKYNVTVLGSALGHIKVFDQNNQDWITPSGTPSSVAIGQFMIIQTDADLSNSPTVFQDGNMSPVSSIVMPMQENSYGVYILYDFFGAAVSISANLD